MLCIKLHPLKPWLHPLKSKMHPPPNRNCTPLTDFYQNYGSLPERNDNSSQRIVVSFCSLLSSLFSRIAVSR